MTVATAKPEVFTRKASGLVRVMSPYSAFVYNILTMGLIFPWTYLWAPGALPGGNLFWGIILATLIEIPIAFTYVWLSTALPAPAVIMFFKAGSLAGAGPLPSSCPASSSGFCSGWLCPAGWFHIWALRRSSWAWVRRWAMPVSLI